MSEKRGPYRRTAERRREILDAAAAVFAESGYRAGSLKDIAARVSLDPSSLLHHFGSKRALLEAVLADKIDRDAAALHWDDRVPPERYPAALLRLAERNAGNPGAIGLYSVLAAESITAEHPDSFRDRHAQTREAFTEGFAAMADAGLLREGVDAASAAASLFALWDGAQTHWLIDPDAVDVVALLRAHLRLLTTVSV